MRQWDEIERVTFAMDAKFSAHDLFELCAVDELRDGKAADWNNKPRLQNADFSFHPRGAIADLVRRGDPIAAAGGLARKTAANSGEVDCRS